MAYSITGTSLCQAAEARRSERVPPGSRLNLHDGFRLRRVPSVPSGHELPRPGQPGQLQRDRLLPPQRPDLQERPVGGRFRRQRRRRRIRRACRRQVTPRWGLRPRVVGTITQGCARGLSNDAALRLRCSGHWPSRPARRFVAGQTSRRAPAKDGGSRQNAAQAGTTKHAGR